MSDKLRIVMTATVGGDLTVEMSSGTLTHTKEPEKKTNEKQLILLSFRLMVILNCSFARSDCDINCIDVLQRIIREQKDFFMIIKIDRIVPQQKSLKNFISTQKRKNLC